MTNSEWISMGGYLIAVLGVLATAYRKLDATSIAAKTANETANKLREEVGAINVKVAEHSIEISHLHRSSDKHDSRLTRLETASFNL